MVNNAGLMTFHALSALTHEDWQRVMDVDLMGTFYFIKHGFGITNPCSAVVNVASIHAMQTNPLHAPYAAAKAALLSLTRSAAIEGKSRGIRVNAILPGAIDTPMLWNNPNVRSDAEQTIQALLANRKMWPPPLPFWHRTTPHLSKAPRSLSMAVG